MITLVLFALTLVGIALVAMCSRRRDLALAAMIGCTAGFADLQVARVHVFTLLVVVWSLFVFGRRADRVVGWAVALVGACVLLASTALVGDLVVSVTLALQLLVLTFCAVAIALWSTSQERLAMLYGLLATTSVSAFYALLQVAGIAATQVVHLDISSVGRPYGLTPEPDWLGMFSAIGMFLAFTLPLRRGLRVALMGLNAIAWLLAFARAAWVAVAVVAVVLAVLALVDVRRARSSTSPRGRKRSMAIATTVVAAVVATQPTLRTDVVTRVTQILGAGSGASAGDRSGQARIEQVTSLMELARDAPFYGHGLSAAGRVGVSGKLYLTGYSPNSVASNWILGLWVDARYLAVPFIALMVVLIARRITTLSGQIVALVLMCSLFSNATYFPVFWLALGLTIADRSGPAAITLLRRARDPDRADEPERRRRPRLGRHSRPSPLVAPIRSSAATDRS